MISLCTNMDGFKRIFLNTNKKDISYIKYIMEGYDGLGIVSTVAPSEALLSITFPEQMQQTLMLLIDAIRREGVLTEVITL